jgi:hypothetical protein
LQDGDSFALRKLVVLAPSLELVNDGMDAGFAEVGGVGFTGPDSRLVLG